MLNHLVHTVWIGLLQTLRDWRDFQAPYENLPFHKHSYTVLNAIHLPTAGASYSVWLLLLREWQMCVLLRLLDLCRHLAGLYVLPLSFLRPAHAYAWQAILFCRCPTFLAPNVWSRWQKDAPSKVYHRFDAGPNSGKFTQILSPIFL